MSSSTLNLSFLDSLPMDRDAELGDAAADGDAGALGALFGADPAHFAHPTFAIPAIAN
ncbi:hypothetical protein HK405_009689, partial [Cladochytrium tenue]